MIKRGTIVLTKFPFTDLRAYKRRPAVVISKDNKSKTDFILAFITSVIPDNLSKTDLLLDLSHFDFKNSGLKKASLIKLDKIATINRSIITGELGYVSLGTLKEIDKRLKIALGLK
ncbi:MAG: type II toxin-antitoxin system PemK/MazF family toxin [Bacteroidota bacterium]